MDYNKTRHNYMLPKKKLTSALRTHNRLKVKTWKQILYASGNQDRTVVDKPISNKSL